MTTNKNCQNVKADRASAFTRGKRPGTTQGGKLPKIARRTMYSTSPPRGRVATLVAGMAALAVATLGFASAAGAAGNAPSLQKPSVIEGASASGYLAGYQATPTGGLASASVTFTVPTISCTPKEIADGAVEWAGVYTDTESAQAFVDAFCTSSVPTYHYVLKTLAGGFSQPAAAGDVVVASLFQSATSTWAEIHDLTNGQYWFDDNSANQGDTVVDIGTFSYAYDGVLVPTFKKIKFTNATVNGDYLGFDSPTEYNTLNGGDLVIKAGALTTGATGSSFSDTFKHAS